ncbi:MAG: Crp/Fnr family transcriptional regulator [Bacteroidales bacterium]|nr:Crp/Fnr family transcriptional regulator [Bacteroidales bacterium]
MKYTQSFPAFNNCFQDTKSVFRHLSNEELELIPQEQAPDFYKRGEIIYSEGSRINGFYYVMKGIIKIYKTGFDGKEQIIRFAQAGDIMGFRSTISNELACTTSRAIEDSYICFVPGDIVKQFVKINGNFAMELLQIACKELGEANDYITDIAQKTVRERLAEVLIHLKMEFGLDNENFLQISLTREELANIVGTATESVIRLLSEFKQDKHIEIHGRRIKILNEKVLLKISNLPY